MGQHLTDLVASVFGGTGYGAVFFLMALESSVFPVPSEAVMIPAGYLAALGKLDPLLAIAAGGLGSVLGALANYYVLGRWLGKPFLEKYGKWVLVTPEKYARGEKLFLKGANFFTFVGRFIPVVRHVISIPAGIFRMPLAPFLLLTWIGSTLWCAVLVAAGWFFGEKMVAFFTEFSSMTLLVFEVLLALVVLRLGLHLAKKRWGRKSEWIVLAVFLAAAYAGGFSFVPKLEALLMFPKAGYAKMELPDVQAVTLSGSQGPISAAYAGTPSKGTVLYFHGNGQPLADLGYHLRFFTDLGYAVLAPDYPGYGESVGRPNEASAYDTADKAYAYLADVRKVPAASIVIVGYSVGTGPASWLASKRPAGALVLMAPYASMQAMGRALYGFAPQRLWNLPDTFDTLGRAPGLTLPALVIHGDADATIPQAQGAQVFSALGSSRKKFASVPGAGHNSLFRERIADAAAAWKDFFGTK